MPDVTYIERYDPSEFPLPPSNASLFDYYEDVEYEGSKLSIEWASNEIKADLLSFVRVGIVAAKVRRYRLYQLAAEKFSSFRDYCERALGKTQWHINRIIEAARVVLELAREGFELLPQNEAQARPLVKFSGDELIAKWQEVIDSCPPHRITANHVAEIVTPGAAPKQQAIKVDAEDYSQLREKAAQMGITPQQLMKKLINDCHPESEVMEVAEPEPELEAEVIQPVTAKAIALWVEDMKQLIFGCYGINLPLAADSS